MTLYGLNNLAIFAYGSLLSDPGEKIAADWQEAEQIVMNSYRGLDTQEREIIGT